MDELTQEHLKSILNYDQETGHFMWIKAGHGVKIGRIAGSRCNNYIHIVIKGRRYYAHRLAWFYMTGKWPTNQIDHKNGIKNDNKWKNIREATASENGMNKGPLKNNTSGHKGVSWHKASKKWASVISINHNNKILGFFDDPEKAAQVYRDAAEKYHGEFANY